MRDPDLLRKSYELEVPSGVITIDSIPEYRYFDYDLSDDKEYNKFIEAVKKDAHNSFEYKQMVKYLRDYVDMNQCAFFKNVSNEDSTKIRIEIHHEPFSIHDIINIVVRKRMDLRESMEVESCSREVMYLHYNMMVGLIPLSETVHELVHNQFLFVPTTHVYGKYKEFMNRYDPWILPEQKEIISKIEEYSTEIDDDYKEILKRHYIYTNMTGEDYNQYTTEDILKSIKERINEIMNP